METVRKGERGAKKEFRRQESGELSIEHGA
jgi:hypothetical protein